MTIGAGVDQRQISGWYTRIMRDEVLAQWQSDENFTLHVHCHVSGGLVVGSAAWRDSILHDHMPMVLQAFRYGDEALVYAHPAIAQAPVIVHFHTRQKQLDKVEAWGLLDDYRFDC